MTTWADLLNDLRFDLRDTATSKRWGDELLYLYTKDAIRDYSTFFPRRINRVEMTVADGYATLPSDTVEVVYVECPRDTFLKPRGSRPGVKFASRPGRPTLYDIEGGSLYLNGSPQTGDETLLTYDALHNVPASLNDDDFVLTIPDGDLELIRLYAKGKAYEWMRGRTAALDRFKPAGKRDDNPIVPEVDDLMDEYKRKIAERVGGKTVFLHRSGNIPGNVR